MKKQHERIALGVIILFLIILQAVFLITKYQHVHWDEAVYIGMGKFIFSAGQIGLYESIRPIGLPLMLGILWKLGAGITAYHILLFVIAISTAALTYKLAKRIDPKAALYAAAILVITPVFVQASFNILTEVVAAFFILLTLYAYITKKHPCIVGILCSITFVVKFPAGLILAAILTCYCIDIKRKKLFSKRSPLISVIFGFISLQIPILAGNYLMYKEVTSNWFDATFRPIILASKHAGNTVHAVESIMSNLLYYPIEIVINNPLLTVAILGIIIALYNTKQRAQSKTLLITVLFFLAYFTAITNKQLRFAVVFLPIITIFAGIGVQKIIQKTSTTLKIKQTIPILLILILSSLILYPAFTQVFKFYPDEQTGIEKEYYMYFADKDATILTTEPYFVAFSDTILAIPYYDNPQEALVLYNQYKSDVDYVVFNNDFYPCNEDQECIETIATIETDLVTNYNLVYEEEWDESTKRIFTN